MNIDKQLANGETERSDAPQPLILVQEDLVADKNSDLQLGGEPGLSDQPRDSEIHGSRFMLVRHAVKLMGDGAGLVVELESSFQPAPGMRFSYAQVEISLDLPREAVFTDIAPREAYEKEPVVYKLKSGATLQLGLKSVEASVGRDSTSETTSYPCRVTGTGIGSRRARWTLYENEVLNNGIGTHQRLVIVLQGTGPFKLETMTSCSLVREGLVGVPGRIRELILGPHMRQGKLSRFTITDPAQSK